MRMATAHHHFREMIGLWSLVRCWLESQPAFHIVTIYLSLSTDHQLLPLSTRSAKHRWWFFFSPATSETTVTSPPHHLLPCFLYFETRRCACSHSVSPVLPEQARRRWVYADVLVFKYAFNLCEYTNHLWLNIVLSCTYFCMNCSLLWQWEIG